MRSASLTVIMFAAILGSPAFAQESSREDFQKFCEAWEGRWVGQVTWVADWPGLGKRGDKVTAYWEGRLTDDGNTMIGKFNGGTGSSTSFIFFDPADKQIKWLWVESGGRVCHTTMHSKDGKWFQKGTSVSPDGSESEYESTVTITDNGDTHTWTGSGTVDGKKIDDQHDVWHRMHK